jgi:ectoine hydroxylase
MSDGRFVWLAVACCAIGVGMHFGTAGRRRCTETLAAMAVDDAVVSHHLSSEERADFEANGFLVLPEVLSAGEVASLSAAMDEWSDQMGGVDEGTTWHGMLFDKRHDTPFWHAGLIRLLVHPRVFGKIVGILGWNIYCYHAHAMFTRAVASPAADATLIEPLGDHWHQDSGRVNDDVEGEPRPRLSVKASFFLTDTTRPGAPQFWAVPGSHLNNSMPNVHAGATEQPPGAMRIPVPAGSVVIIDRRLWHAGPLGEQRYARSRKVLFYGFGPRWMRPKDAMATHAVLPHIRDPVIRQLLGDTPTFNGLYSPTARDAPLLGWLDEHGMLDERPPVPWEACDQSSKWIGGCT